MDWRDGDWIVTSALDTDFYKFSMGQMIFRHYADVEVTFGLINRSRAPLAALIPEEELRCELDHVQRHIHLNNTNLHYLRGTNEYGDRMFGEDYLQFMKSLELPPYYLERVGDDYRLEFTGPWARVTHWEIPALFVLSELYYRAQLRMMSKFEREAVYATGISRLMEKVKIWRQYPEITFSDFGTRRRFSRSWQDYVVEVLTKELLPEQFLGTSNVLLAMNRGLLPMGTSAHELQMVIAALAFAKADGSCPDAEILGEAQDEVLGRWYDMYGYGLSIALTDTFGSPFFFRTAAPHIARDWKGTRQDSGDPFEYGERAIQWYERHHVDSREKLIVFSDQQRAELMVKLHLHFQKRIGVAFTKLIGTTFGIGTNLTNDLGLKPISIVVKALEVDGCSTVKLSDNLAKAMGRSEDVERYKRAAGYTNDKSIECEY